MKSLSSCFIPLICLLAACSKMPELPKTGTPKIVLLGELVAGDSVYFRAAQSNPVIEGGSTKRTVIRNLSISIQTPEGNLWQLITAEDDMTIQEATLPYFSANVVQASSVYNVTATQPQFGTAKAKVSVPKAFAATIIDTISETHLGEPCYKVRLSVSDLPESGNAYAIEVVQQPYTADSTFFFNGQWLKKSEHSDILDSLVNAGVDVERRLDSFYVRSFQRVPFFCEDPFAEHVLTGNTTSLVARSIFTDVQNNGSQMFSTIYIPKSRLLSSDPVFGGYKTWVQVKSISADYFEYLKAYAQMGSGFDLEILSNKVVIKGNVENGLGIIGGVFRRQFGFDW